MWDEEERSEHMAGSQRQVGERTDQAAQYHRGCGQPVGWNDAPEPVSEEMERGNRSSLRDRPHDEPADDEKDIHSGGPDDEMSAGALGGVEDDDPDRGDRAKVLHAI